jgi:hypothetical protein
VDPLTPLKQARQEQSLLELDRLIAEFDSWLDQCRNLDRDAQGIYVGRHKTQLEAIESVVLGALRALRHHLHALDLVRPAGDVYDDCRDYDMAIVWARRLWSYYRDKFDQRLDEERMRPLLRAADEVVWSCYRQVFVRAPNSPQGAPPLPFIEPAFAPGAIVAGRLPPALKLFVDLPFLDPFLAKLPLPLLQLPPWFVDAPWWLVYVGHEVGHFIQKDLGLEQPFREGVAAAAKAAGSAQDQAFWEAWHREIFADIFSLTVMGPWAIYAIRDAEWASPAAMALRKDEYPAPAIRLAIMVEAAARLGLDVKMIDGMLAAVDLKTAIESTPETRRDRDVIPGLVEFALGPLPDSLGTLAVLGAFDAAAYAPNGGRVGNWAAALRGANEPVVGQNLRIARELACGSLSAVARLMTVDAGTVAGVDEAAVAAQRRAASTALGKRTCQGLIRSAEPGTRGKLAPSGQRPAAAQDLADRLLQISRERRQQGQPAAPGGDDASSD